MVYAVGYTEQSLSIGAVCAGSELRKVLTSIVFVEIGPYVERGFLEIAYAPALILEEPDRLPPFYPVVAR